MSSVVGANSTERARVFETVLSAPGLTETCKIVLNPSRQTILLLSRLIEQGLEAGDKGAGDELLSHLPAESHNELKAVAEEMLKRSGLVDFYQRLKTL